METQIETKRRGNVAAMVYVMTDSATPTRPFDNISRLVMVTFRPEKSQGLSAYEIREVHETYPV